MVLSHKTDTPDNLVLRIIQPKQYSSAATRYGIENEPVAVKQYMHAHQNQHGHLDLIVSASGFFINTDYPYLGLLQMELFMTHMNHSNHLDFWKLSAPTQPKTLVQAKHVQHWAFFVNLSGY